jgi:hypothetical protein
VGSGVAIRLRGILACHDDVQLYDISAAESHPFHARDGVDDVQVRSYPVGETRFY